MNLVGLMPCRNEEWIVGLSARVALRWCDALVILEHASTDRTPELLQCLKSEYGSRVEIIRETSREWREMYHRQALLERARDLRATHIALIDADEVVTGNLVPSLRNVIESIGRDMLHLPGFNLRGGISRYHANGIWGNRWFSVAFADNPRLRWDGDRFHQREPSGAYLSAERPVAQRNGGVMHLWGASERRLVAKHCAYKMIETLRWPSKSRAEIDRLYTLAFDPQANLQFDQTWRFAETPANWWRPYDDLLPYLHVDAEPWQEDACRLLYAEYGPERFAGLNLFGVVGKAKEFTCHSSVA